MRDDIWNMELGALDPVNDDLTYQLKGFQLLEEDSTNPRLEPPPSGFVVDILHV